ncbi:tetratricopeptide repeat protein, partial [Pseudomonas aeruginosa]
PQLRYQAKSWLAMLHLSRNNYQDALQVAQEATQLQPHSGLAHSNLSLVLFYAGQPREAQRVAQKAVEIAPDSVVARCALG